MHPRLNNINYPRNKKQCFKLLKNLGFEQVKRIGKGSHQYKYTHPTLEMNCQNERPFIIIPYKYYNLLGKKLVKKLICYSFS